MGIDGAVVISLGEIVGDVMLRNTVVGASVVTLAKTVGLAVVGTRVGDAVGALVFVPFTGTKVG